MSYNNPYYNNGYGSYGNYSYAQPIPVASPVVAAGANVSACDQSLNLAADAFKQNNYDLALDTINKGIVTCPTDAVLHEFRGLVLFAKNDYQQAASTLHSVLAVGPGWNWTTLSGLYSDTATYTGQLRALEAFARQNPQDAAGHFLLGYHYLVDGYPDNAATQFSAVVKLVPGDRVASDILTLVSKPSSAQLASTSGQPATSTGSLPSPQPPDGTQVTASKPVAVTPIDAATLPGTWRASRR